MQTELSYDLTHESSFSYSCNRCRKCCYKKRVTLTPYEILRLARNMGITTREFISRFTEEAGTRLRFRSEDGACSLLGAEGCTVHSDRPGACRVYPLGGLFQVEGPETFKQLTPDPDSLGVYGSTATFKAGDTVGSFLKSQGVEPYHRANRRYMELLGKLMPLIAEQVTKQLVTETRAETSCSEFEISEWFDVDTVIETYCAKENIPVPPDLDAQVELHIKAMEAWALSSAQLAVSSDQTMS